MKQAHRLWPLVAALALCACGGGGSGSNANVNSSVSRVTVGGSISGLTALSGLVLLDNGGDALTVSPNATSFTFATPLNAGSAYAVSVQSPGPTGETCTVANGSGTASANVTNVSISCASRFATAAANIVSMSIAPGPADPGFQTFNIPLVTVTVCDASSKCAQIPDVLVDTGSAGLRIMASVAAKAGLSLPAEPDPNPLNPGNTLHECMQFAAGDAWGAVSTATVKIGGESTGGAIPVEVMDDSASPPSFCQSGANMSRVDAFDANGVLGVGVNDQDCGSACASASNTVYYSCPASGTCQATAMATGQVANPVVSFPTDNNGVILQLPAIPAAGATGASGYLVFGIGTQSNNALDASAAKLTADSAGRFTTQYGSLSLTDSLLDSGSDALFFPNSGATTLPTCPDPPAGAGSGFYCPTGNPPSSPLALSATNQGSDGTTSQVEFAVVDLDQLSSSNFALPNVAGPASTTNPPPPQWMNFFDWGLPFFYGRTVYVMIGGTAVGGQYGTYAY